MDNEKELLKRLTEKAQKASRYWQVEMSDFYAREILIPLLDVLSHEDATCTLWGGYQEAERVRLVFSMEDFEMVAQDTMMLLALRGNKNFLKASHRDYLGALMSLGLKREKFGDIIVRDDGADVILDKRAADFLLSSEIKIRRMPMKVSLLSWENWQAPMPNLEKIELQLASERLDGMVAKAFHLSRTLSTELIKKEAVFLNYKVVTNASLSLKAGDIVSVRGKGKFKVGEIQGLSKKGKLKQVIYLYC